MNDRDAELIISSLRGYSTEASKVLEYIHKYDYRSEAAAWDTNRNPSLLEVEHPTLYDLFIRLAHYINQNPTGTITSHGIHCCVKTISNHSVDISTQVRTLS